eukprot:scpid36674/ scgid33879/ 
MPRVSRYTKTAVANIVSFDGCDGGRTSTDTISARVDPGLLLTMECPWIVGRDKHGLRPKARAFCWTSLAEPSKQQLLRLTGIRHLRNMPKPLHAPLADAGGQQLGVPPTSPHLFIVTESQQLLLVSPSHTNQDNT